MNIIDIINKKRVGEVLSNEEISFAVDGYVKGEIPDYQMSAFLMSICINGMSLDEVSNLTNAMLRSGEQLDFSYLGSNVVDKHSTGGVGDKTTLLLAPIVAASGLIVAKMSGRGLGFTGGTIDKLESIDGFRVKLTNEEFKKQVEDIHMAVVYGNESLVLADKKMYALRDVTGTVESIPLIASSIMSKKIAAGSKKIVIDVKVGRGALMKNVDDARALAHTMIEIGKQHGVLVRCVLTRMDAPLGYAIGNGLEVMEVKDFLKGNCAPDLKELVVTLASHMVSLGLSIPFLEAESKVNEVLNHHTGYEYLEKMVTYQGGNLDLVQVSSNTYQVLSNKQGYIHDIDAYLLAEVSLKLGSGRLELTDEIDLGVGIYLNKKPGDFVNVGENLATIYYNKVRVSEDEVLKAFTILEEEKKLESVIIEVVS